MKNINTICLILIISILSFPLTGQNEIKNVDEQTGSNVTEVSIDFEGLTPLPQEKHRTEMKTVLSQPVTLRFLDAHLTDVIKEISKQQRVSFTYDDNLLNIKKIQLQAEEEPLYRVLDELLGTYGISYYEYEAGKIVLAKQTKINEKTGAIKGVVKDDKGEKLLGVNVMIKELHIGCATDIGGNYSIKNIRPGEYTLETSSVGYEKDVRKIKVSEGKMLEINIVLKSSAFQIGEIEVVGTSELLPRDVNTKTTISSAEIEHFQASSIGDVLDLVPGIQRTSNPGLGKLSQVGVRGDESDNLTAFGTLILVDGIPQSNNANMQFERLTGSNSGNSNLGRGVDLRTIPADNINNIEVITGLPSVRYGDVTAGIINVQTKIGKAPNRLKIKNNPDTREGNFGGGILVGEGAFSYNLNVAQSERDIRITGDEYLRLTGQVVYSMNMFDNALASNYKVNYQRILDEEEPKGDMQKTRNYNRSYTIGLSTWGKYKPEDGVSMWEYNIFTNMRTENSMKSKLNSEYVVLWSGDTVSTYIGKVETRGIEWTIGGRLEWNKVFYTGDIIHRVLVGIDPQYNANTGEGVVFDTLLSYYGVGSGRRPYSFDEIPGQLLASVYVEDKITGHLFFDYNLMLGFRYEMYRPYEFNLSGLWGDGDIVKSHQGTFFNPRMNLMIYLTEVNQLRISAGVSTKSPPMSTIYPPEDVMKWRNPDLGTISYFRYNLQVPELKGYRETMFEAAYDHKFMNLFGITLSGYYKQRNAEPIGMPNPVFSITNLGSAYSIYYVDYYSLPVNIGQSYSRGLELNFKTAKVQALNMDFQITAAYNHINNPGEGIVYSNTPNALKGQYPNYTVPDSPIDTLIGWIYPSGGRWADRLQLNYYVKYTLADLGLWITLRAEQLVFERNQNYNLIPVDYNLLTETQKLDRVFDGDIKVKPNKWLFNISMSKSLFPGGEVSFYVNNLFDDPAVRRYFNTRTTEMEDSRNPSLFYGIEFSMSVDRLFGGGDD
ncbi:MAG: TonB-dependent receptor [Ignavibacteriales bacterium]|jgi:hypothetical protein|nr:TonB-dependent receptor [Ignavibacteriaceae bacterium]NLH62139.1 TonB-dependent receptor [Ignavibacteriales bacterium]HOJ17839.1 TonB-dependent receptor [Ignavibacteriaceae bacterium]HPO55014.1 TonB-dependent receptor [Ignavibacteriaceae bacterium]